MKKALAVVAILSVASFAFAQGTVTIYLSNSADGYGLDDFAGIDKSFDPAGHENISGDMTEAAGFDMSNFFGEVPYELAQAGAPAMEAPVINPTAGEFAYIWLHMDDVVKAKKIQGIDLGIGSPDDARVEDVAYYVLDNTEASTNANKRWDGAYTLEGEPEFRNNPQVLAAVTAQGIKNTDEDPAGSLLQADYGDEQQGGGFPPVTTADSTYLLGAVQFAPGSYSIEPFLGSLGLAFDGYEVDAVNLMGATIVPEPASFALIALAGLLIRRR